MYEEKNGLNREREKGKSFFIQKRMKKCLLFWIGEWKKGRRRKEKREEQKKRKERRALLQFSLVVLFVFQLPSLFERRVRFTLLYRRQEELTVP